ncbi:carboxymuconolactone decarboxylase family protein [Sphingopyxis sp. CCNWLW253]|uniref:carboxymuconolactone decarboxylase family protein n=1 Tax=unclassified Sphingopyxis TaxID=2614943 RepID=UPI003012E211
MTPRMNIFQAAPDAMKAMLAVEASFETSGLEHGLIELVKLRASQINGCAFCIHMHVKDAVKHGENDMRIHLLSAWRHSPVFTDRERAALNWTEVLTRVAKSHAPDADFELLKAHFSDKEIAYLTVVIGAINFWNQVQIGLRMIHPAEEAAAIAA